jgi:uncharacterized protein
MPSLEHRRQRAIREFAGQLRASLGALLADVRLFGSVARGDARPDSDIDILVVVHAADHDRSRFERAVVDIAFDVNLEHDVYISPRVVTEGLLADPVWGRTPFIESVRRDSVAL